MILLILFFIFSVFLAYTSAFGAPWVPVRSFDVEELLDDAGVKKGITYLELGCGDGRLVSVAAKRGANAIGYEFNPVIFIFAWLRCLGQANAKVRFANFWHINLSQADVVMVFLVPKTMPRLAVKAANEMKPNSVLVSYIFEIKDKKPLKKGKSWFVYDFKKASEQKK